MFDSSFLEFYYTAFACSDGEKDKINKTLEILNKAYQQICHDKTNPSNQEKWMKAAVLCVKMNDDTWYRTELKVKENFLRHWVTTSKSNWNWNFKETNRLMDLLRFMKDILNNSKGEDSLATPWQIFEDYSLSKDLYRKLNQWFNSIFDLNSETVFNYKRWIWAVFINVCHRKWSNHTNVYERLKILISTFLGVVLRVPNDFFPLRYKITNETKWNVIETHIKSKLPHIEIIDRTEIIGEEILRRSPGIVFDLGNKENLQVIIEHYYNEYKERYWSHDKFDERLLLCHWYQTNSNSPMKSFWYKNENISCSRKLTFDVPSSVKHSRKGNNDTATNKLSSSSLSMIDMTPCTRVVTLNKWFSDYTRNFNAETLDELQVKYRAPGYGFPRELIPITKYVNDKIKAFCTNSPWYQNCPAHGSIEDKSNLCLKFLSTWILSENVWFTEEFNTRLLFNERFINAIITWSFEISLWIDDEQEITFNKLIRWMNVDIYDLWKVLSPFNIKYSLSIKPVVKEHIEEIEYQIISFLMWKNPSHQFTEDLQSFFADDVSATGQEKQSLVNLADFEFNHQSLFMFHKEEDFAQGRFTQELEDGPYTEISNYVHWYPKLGAMSIFLRRVVNYCNCLNKAIFDSLDLNWTRFALESEDLIKKIIISDNNIKVLFGRHLDQIVLCCIMAVLISHNILSWTNSNLSSDVIKLHNEFKITKINMEQWYTSYQVSKTGQTWQTSKWIFSHVKLDSVGWGGWSGGGTSTNSNNNNNNNSNNNNNNKNETAKFVGCERFFEEYFKVVFDDIIKDVTLHPGTNTNGDDDSIAYCFEEDDDINQIKAVKKRKTSSDRADVQDPKAPFESNVNNNNNNNNNTDKIAKASWLESYNKDSLACKSAYTNKMEYYTPLKRKFGKDNKGIQSYPNWNLEKIPHRSLKLKDIYCNTINWQIKITPKNKNPIVMKLRNCLDSGKGIEFKKDAAPTSSKKSTPLYKAENHFNNSKFPGNNIKFLNFNISSGKDSNTGVNPDEEGRNDATNISGFWSEQRVGDSRCGNDKDNSKNPSN